MFNLLQICRPINEIFTQSLKKRVYGRCPVSNFKQASCAATFLDNCARQTASLPQGNGSAGAGIGASQSRERPRAWHNCSKKGTIAILADAWAKSRELYSRWQVSTYADGVFTRPDNENRVIATEEKSVLWINTSCFWAKQCMLTLTFSIACGVDTRRSS